MIGIDKFLDNLLKGLGLGETGTDILANLILLACIALIVFVVTKLFHAIVVPIIKKFTASSATKWDDVLLNHTFLTRLSRLIPPIVWYMFSPIVLRDSEFLSTLFMKACLIYFVVVLVMLIDSFLHSLHELSMGHEKLRNRPMKGVYQMLNIISISLGAIFIISILLDTNAAAIIAGLGASAAVLMLIFKDSILGLVASIQLSANDMLRPGDWITMSKYGANGYVTEVSLTAVKVQNFDMTITTIPPYALVSDSFQNWRGMWGSGGRRIMRALYIDVNSVRFCTESEIKKFKEEGLVTDADMPISDEVVNLKVFRNFIISKLKSLPDVRQDMLMMVRQLAPTPEGLPLEVYCFIKFQNWAEYEAYQSNLMDYLLASLQRFGLRMYQRPSGLDFTDKTLKN